MGGLSSKLRRGSGVTVRAPSLGDSGESDGDFWAENKFFTIFDDGVTVVEAGVDVCKGVLGRLEGIAMPLDEGEDVGLPDTGLSDSASFDSSFSLVERLPNVEAGSLTSLLVEATTGVVVGAVVVVGLENEVDEAEEVDPKVGKTGAAAFSESDLGRLKLKPDDVDVDDDPKTGVAVVDVEVFLSLSFLGRLNEKPELAVDPDLSVDDDVVLLPNEGRAAAAGFSFSVVSVFAGLRLKENGVDDEDPNVEAVVTTGFSEEVESVLGRVKLKEEDGLSVVDVEVEPNETGAVGLNENEDIGLASFLLATGESIGESEAFSKIFEFDIEGANTLTGVEVAGFVVIKDVDPGVVGVKENGVVDDD